jgi:anti-sigma B factor antagonist
MGSLLDFQVASESLGSDAWLVRVTGEADLATATQLGAALDDVADGRAARVIVDLAGTSFVDSTTLAVLLEAHRCLQEHGGDLVLVTGGAHVRRALELTHLDRAFRIEPTLAEAIEALRERRP